MKKDIFLISIYLCFLFFYSCAKKIDKEVIQEKNRLVSIVEKEPYNIDAYEKLMFIEAVKTDEPKSIILQYESNKDLLCSSCMIRIYYASSLCKMAGKKQSTEKILDWIQKGINEFDELIRIYPYEPQIYLWRAVTYSNFPKIMSVNEIVEDDMKKVNVFIENGYSFSGKEMKVIGQIYMNLYKNYSDDKYLELYHNFLLQKGPYFE